MQIQIVGRGTDGNLSCRMGWEGMGGMFSSGVGRGSSGLDGKGWGWGGGVWGYLCIHFLYCFFVPVNRPLGKLFISDAGFYEKNASTTLTK